MHMPMTISPGGWRMKDKKIIILAVILLTLVGYYVWYSQKTAAPKPKGRQKKKPKHQGPQIRQRQGIEILLPLAELDLNEQGALKE